MDSLDFSEQEIQEQLAALGYKNIPKHRLIEFKQDLDKLIQDGELKSLATATHTRAKPSTSELRHHLPAFTKEKVSQCYIKSNGEGFFLHPGKGGHDRQPLAPNENRSYGWQQTLRDAYAYHSVAPRLQPPPEAPSRLQVEADTEDSLPSLLSNSATSSPDTQQRRFVKRKVLRKHKGQSLVCDESFYSEDSAPAFKPRDCASGTPCTSAAERAASMYKMCDSQWDENSSQDENSLNSSFWSDGEKQDEEEEEVELERGAVSRPADDPDGFSQKTSDQQKTELDSLWNGAVLEEDRREEDEEGDDKETTSSSSESPAPSLMTSGYGTCRAEEQEGADHRDDRTIAEFDQDSQGDLSELRDEDEEDRGSFAGVGDTPACVSDAEGAGRGDDGPPAIGTKPKEGKETPENTVLLAERPLREGLHRKEDQKREEIQHLHEVQDPEESPIYTSPKSSDSQTDFRRKNEEGERSQRQKRGGKELLEKSYVASRLEEQLADLQLSTSARRRFQEEEDASTESDTQSSQTDGISLSAFESYIRGMTGTRSDVDVRQKPKSFIRPVMSQQTLKKTDPVAKYFQYKQLWDMFKLPGEADRKALRWEIKERLAYQPPPPKPRRVYVPNTYVVPTEKKRSALRWEVRNDLASGLPPHRFTYRF